MAVVVTDQPASQPRAATEAAGRRLVAGLAHARDLPPELLLLGFLGILVAIFSFTTPVFASPENFQNLVKQASILAILAAGQLFPILVGGLDISQIGVISFISILAATLASRVDVPIAFLVAVLAGIGIGAINGVLVSYLRVSAIIATLGMWQILFGASVVWTQGLPVRPDSDSYGTLGQGKIWLIATPTFVAVCVAILGTVVLKRTQLGRYVYAIGGNAEAARLSGINVRFYRALAYVWSGGLTALAAIIASSRIESGEATLGASLGLLAIAAVFIGGAAWEGGVGTVLGVVLGALTLQTIQNGLILRGVSSDIQTAVTGALIIISVVAYGFRRRARSV
jgi:ribose transport system permease protein